MASFAESTIIYGCDIDGKSTGNTTLVTLDHGYVIYQIHVILTTVSGLVTGPTFSIGTNSTSFNNLASLVALTALTVVNNVLNIAGASQSVHMSAGDAITVKVNTAAIGTTYNFQVIVVGYPL